ncbi:hypothetical protein TUMSATVNIG1_13820 [Vibrio nigripulchritudo]|uniref:hypothetical protein n=1 Tax=Vibrio nigripulchritudo TaxID=28173 RepID=UPI00190BF985|nr:hypothetical protein [Vibrio nigripulchritudo]BCL69433.1 hypothetical protein VNTUMSATTG_13700 [Vibrio nigripulchritudo]BDU30773.1 hypothetical protein TUMSATVNIG1_13820 [Vibrio nigripulchritudo]
MEICESTYYRRQHITGNGCVLVSIRFGNALADGVLITKKLAKNTVSSDIKFDLDNHVREIISGVNDANEMYSGSLEVQEIEVIPSDFPVVGQAKNAAFLIAEYVLNKST